MMLNPFRSTPPTATIENDALIVHYHEPFNAEPPRARLRATFITPRHGFHVRSHGAIPVIDPAAHRLRIEGMAAPLTLSV